jgi:hypothetical protein
MRRMGYKSVIEEAQLSLPSCTHAASFSSSFPQMMYLLEKWSIHPAGHNLASCVNQIAAIITFHIVAGNHKYVSS